MPNAGPLTTAIFLENRGIVSRKRGVRSVSDMEGFGMAVDGNGLAGHHSCRRRGEVATHIGDLLGLHESFDRLSLDVFLLDDFGRHPSSRGLSLDHVLHACAFDRTGA